MNIIGIYEGEKIKAIIAMISRKKVSQTGIPVIMIEGYLSLLEANEHFPEIPPHTFRVLHNRTDVSIRTNHNNA